MIQEVLCLLRVIVPIWLSESEFTQSIKSGSQSVPKLQFYECCGQMCVHGWLVESFEELQVYKERLHCMWLYVAVLVTDCKWLAYKYMDCLYGMLYLADIWYLQAYKEWSNGVLITWCWLGDSSLKGNKFTGARYGYTWCMILHDWYSDKF